MVAGSGPDPGSADKSNSKCLYDGKLDSWPAAIRGHLMETGVVFTKPTRLENDNSGGVLVARDAASMHHSRATAMRAVFCQECVEQGMYDPVHVPAEKMTADVLTKWLPLNDFGKHRAKLTNRRAQSKMLELK